MPKRKNSFTRALADASKRLQKALAERERAQQRIVQLNLEIPQLQNIIVALSPDRVMYRNSQTGQETQPQNMTPEELAKWYTEQDLSKLGSVPVAQPTEEELLPPPEGEPLIEE